METDGVDLVTVEITHERLVSRIAKVITELGGSQAVAIATEFVDDIDLTLRRAVYGDGVTSIPVEVAGQRDVAGVAEIEPRIG